MAPLQALYQATLDEAAAAGGDLMGRLVTSVGKVLYARELAAKTLYERDALINQGKLLQGQEAQLRAAYPKALQLAFGAPDGEKKDAPRAISELHFDQLELMDETEVHESVVMARAQQVTMMAVDGSLAGLTALVCSLQGLPSVRAERNPLRPEAYLQALKGVVGQLDVPQEIRLDWIGSMSVALGAELNAMYRVLAQQLRVQGVTAAGYVVQNLAQRPVAGGGGTPAGPSAGGGTVARAAARTGTRAGTVRGESEAVLTLDKLRRLLAGELEPQAPANRLQAFAQQFASEFENSASEPQGPVSDFDATVPAALEALAEMQQVDQVVQRLEQRRQAGPGSMPADGSPVEAIRDVLRRTATGVAQVLSLEVVTLMVDNMARNPRLLEPIQRVIAGLEPALLLLSLVDPRFFTDKQHPARELLQEITHRSLAYESEQASGFAEFLATLEHTVEPLSSAAIDNAEPFERALAQLRQSWDIAAQDQARAREAAVQALQHAEQRNLLAEKIARGIENHPDSARVPEVVIDFLCGPWAQVVAQARLTAGASSQAADKYQALISAMLWSAHPELTRKNTAKLTRLVPLLLATLREGLDTIRYPATKTSAFLEALMGLHQLAFRAADKVPGAQAPTPPPTLEPSLRGHRTDGDDPWVAPEEARASNFMEWSELPEQPAAVPQRTVAELPLGSWVELLVNGQWVRTQLTWASPHGTLFLFTSVFGTPQSMTRRSMDKLVAAGHVRIVSSQTLVDGALDAVAQIALRNSLDATP